MASSCRIPTNATSQQLQAIQPACGDPDALTAAKSITA